MTREEYLEHRNPQGKYHPESAYDFDVLKMNRTTRNVGYARHRNCAYQIDVPVDGRAGDYIISCAGTVVAVVHAGVLYFSPRVHVSDIPRGWTDGREAHTLDIKSTKPIKYPIELVVRLSDVAGRNRRKYPHLLQNLVLNNEPFQIRSEGKPVEDNGTSIAVLNSKGEVVAQATDEWGATLIAVAREYRGRGIGPVLGKHWYRHNPSRKSGGFTPAGEANALRMWEDRVRVFTENGWWSQLTREGRITPAKVREILSGLKGTRPRVEPRPTQPTEKGEVLVYAESPVFVVYDSRFLTDPDEKWVHGYGFFRAADPVGTFLYTIDYDREYTKITTSVALQMARDEGERVWIGKGYGDMLEFDSIAGVKREGDYVELTRDVLPLKRLAARERKMRNHADPYREQESRLLETAEAKW